MADIEVVEFGKEWSEPREKAPVPVKEAKFTLADMAEDWHFFTHGAFFAFAEFDFPREDPVADWYLSQPYPVEILRQPFRKAVFEGLDMVVPGMGGLSWDHVVCGIRKEYWPGLYHFLGGVCAINERSKTFYSTFSGDVAILDPVQVERSSVLDPSIARVTVTAFCIESNHDRWEIRPSLSLVGRPKFHHLPPRREIVAQANGVLSGDASSLVHRHNPAMQQLLEEHNRARKEGPKIIIKEEE